MSVLLHNVEDPVAEVVPVGSPEKLPDEAVQTGVPVEGVHRDARVQGGHLRNSDYPRDSGARLSYTSTGYNTRRPQNLFTGMPGKVDTASPTETSLKNQPKGKRSGNTLRQKNITKFMYI